MARGWAISGISDQTREAVLAAADAAGMPAGAWIEKALSKALAEGLEPGVSIEEIEARLRQVVSDGLQPVQQTLARIEAMAAPPGSAAGGAPANPMRERLRQRRMR